MPDDVADTADGRALDGGVSGEIRVEHYQGGEIVDQHVTEDAIWELMYFGHARSRDD